jgi:hypothetical protein
LVTFGQDDAPVAVEVVQELPDGADPEHDAATTRAEFYVTAGEIHWASTAAGGQAGVETIQGPAHRVLQGAPAPADAEPIKAADLPAWTAASDTSTLKKNAMLFLEKELSGDRPVTLVLKEVAVHRRIENSLLALQALAEIDEFEPFVPFLNNADQLQTPNTWIPLVDGLHAALAWGPEHATRMRKAFEAQRGKGKGLELYTMLGSFNAKQLADGNDRVLVRHLNHEDLDYRVLSFWVLKRITGADFKYHPQATEAKRKQSVQRWQQRLEAGQIVPAEADK